MISPKNHSKENNKTKADQLSLYDLTVGALSSSVSLNTNANFAFCKLAIF